MAGAPQAPLSRPLAMAWGAGLIQDDLATDFVSQIVEGDNADILHRTLSAARSVPGHLPYEPAIRGLIAAEVVAGLAGRPAKAMPAELAGWAAAHGAPEGEPELRRLAATVVERVKEDSELAELWARSEQLAPWVEKVDDLLARLSSSSTSPPPGGEVG